MSATAVVDDHTFFSEVLPRQPLTDTAELRLRGLRESEAKRAAQLWKDLTKLSWIIRHPEVIRSKHQRVHRTGSEPITEPGRLSMECLMHTLDHGTYDNLVALLEQGMCTTAELLRFANCKYLPHHFAWRIDNAIAHAERSLTIAMIMADMSLWTQHVGRIRQAAKNGELTRLIEAGVLCQKAKNWLIELGLGHMLRQGR